MKSTAMNRFDRGAGNLLNRLDQTRVAKGIGRFSLLVVRRSLSLHSSLFLS